MPAAQFSDTSVPASAPPASRVLYRRPFVRRLVPLNARWPSSIVTLSHSGSPSPSGPARRCRRRPLSTCSKRGRAQAPSLLPSPSGARWLTVSRSLSVCPGPDLSHQGVVLSSRSHQVWRTLRLSPWRASPARQSRKKKGEILNHSKVFCCPHQFRLGQGSSIPGRLLSGKARMPWSPCSASGKPRTDYLHPWRDE